MPNCRVRYPACLSRSGNAGALTEWAIPGVGCNPFQFHPEWLSTGSGRSVVGLSPPRCVHWVTPCRTSFMPVIRLTRVGEQTAQEYACVNFIPSRASLSSAGVR